MWRFIGSSVTFFFQLCAVSKYYFKASFRINSLFDRHVLKFFRISPKRAILKKMHVLAFLQLRDDRIQTFSGDGARASHLDKGAK